ncbi:sugar kinase [Salinisphaera sp. Q1T1-3]|uniref:sugar kinase n=1 Tax=Salinisphaera sp. Q1T1-3 TaxID=2321229 RepID=UPI000E757025|nr:sugar kinase [Salinisphaera sp. Q1T1-3]RJS94065.1 sugar kinase [Salinisphaera sp. Q1T1-3]
MTAASRGIDVVTFGECMVLFRAESPGALASADRFTRSIAGAESNVAIGLARLGLRVGWYSRVGDDLFGRQILGALEAEGIDCSGIAIDAERPTGFQIKGRRDDGGDPEVAYFRAGSAASQLSRADLSSEHLPRTRHLHVTGIPPALGAAARDLCRHAMAVVREAGGTISFDPNLRPTLWSSRTDMIAQINALAAEADWFMPGLAEAETLTGLSEPEAIADHYLRAGIREVAIKTGATGAYWATRSACGRAAPIRLGRVVDTVGAGDGFAVGYLSARLEGLSVAAACARGNRLGARVCGHPGDFEGLPHRATLLSEAGSTETRVDTRSGTA